MHLRRPNPFVDCTLSLIPPCAATESNTTTTNTAMGRSDLSLMRWNFCDSFDTLCRICEKVVRRMKIIIDLVYWKCANISRCGVVNCWKILRRFDYIMMVFAWNGPFIFFCKIGYAGIKRFKSTMQHTQRVARLLYKRQKKYRNAIPLSLSLSCTTIIIVVLEKWRDKVTLWYNAHNSLYLLLYTYITFTCILDFCLWCFFLGGGGVSNATKVVENAR